MYVDFRWNIYNDILDNIAIFDIPAYYPTLQGRSSS